MNRKWTIENNADKLENYFHKDMVAITSTDLKRIEGAESCVVGWKNFSENVEIIFGRNQNQKCRFMAKVNLQL